MNDPEAPLIDLQLSLSYGVDHARAIPVGHVSLEYIRLCETYMAQIRAALGGRMGS